MDHTCLAQGKGFVTDFDTLRGSRVKLLLDETIIHAIHSLNTMIVFNYVSNGEYLKCLSDRSSILLASNKHTTPKHCSVDLRGTSKLSIRSSRERATQNVDVHSFSESCTPRSQSTSMALLENKREEVINYPLFIVCVNDILHFLVIDGET
jgi:hypothetical protein